MTISLLSRTVGNGCVPRRWLSARAAASRFVDVAEIVAKGGRGGQGAVSFERLRDGRRGRPNGGNGGSGGDVILRASSSLRGISIPSKTVQGQNGMNGGPNLSHGQRGRDTVIQVPCGTMVYFPGAVSDEDKDGDWLNIFDHDDSEDRERHTNEDRAEAQQAPVDLVKNGDQIVVAKGGRGGVGNRTTNMRYRKGVQYAPVAGAAGTRCRVRIELKVLADIGLVGYPNAGKSTLLSVISRARPQIASYPFTTLQPNLGLVEFDDVRRSRCTVADIPGLIAGAADNRGLGHEFLRHIERTRALLYVVDVAGTEGRDPLHDYHQLRHELALYDPTLVERPALVFANKTDRRPATCARNLERLQAELSVPVIAGSARSRRNLDVLLRAMYELVESERTNTSQSW